MRARFFWRLSGFAFAAAMGGCSQREAPGPHPSASGSVVASVVTSQTGSSPSASASSSSSGAEQAAAPSPILPAVPDDPLTGRRIHADVSWLSAPEQRGRGSASTDEARIATWLGGMLDEANVGVFDKQRAIPFTFGRGRRSQNVLGLIQPADEAARKRELVVLGAHYDHLGKQGGKMYPGAEDNASGTSVNLAIARTLARHPDKLGRPVLVIFFGSEETGLNGSEALVRAWDFKKNPVKAMVNVDMIGRPMIDQPHLWVAGRLLGILPDVDPDNGVGVLIPDKPPEGFAQMVRESCAINQVRAVLVEDLPPVLRGPMEGMGKSRSDQAPFEAKDIPYVFLSTGEFTDYHEPTDTADRIDPATLERRGRAILEIVLRLSR